jgi:TonB family protein
MMQIYRMFFLMASLSGLLACTQTTDAPPSEPSSNATLQADEPPVPINLMEIRQSIGYPKPAAEAGLEGLVVARVLVEKDGSYLQHELVKSVDPRLDQAVVDQLPTLSFEPATKDGQPVRFWVNIPFRFKLAADADH